MVARKEVESIKDKYLMSTLKRIFIARLKFKLDMDEHSDFFPFSINRTQGISDMESMNI